MHKIIRAFFIVLSLLWVGNCYAQIDQRAYLYDKNSANIEWQKTNEKPLIVPAYSYLRIDGASSDTKLLASNGSALFVEQKVVRQNGKLFYFNSNNYPILTKASGQNLSFSISVRPDIQWIKYNKNIVLGKGLTVTDVQNAAHDNFTSLAPDGSINLQIKGPVRLRLRSQIDLGGAYQSKTESYQINVSLDGKDWQKFQPVVALKNAGTISQNGCLIVAYEEGKNYFEIPEGVHNISVAGDRKLLVRLDAEGQNYLIAANAPPKIHDDLQLNAQLAAVGGNFAAATELLKQKPWSEDSFLYGTAYDQIDKYLAYQPLFPISANGSFAWIAKKERLVLPGEEKQSFIPESGLENYLTKAFFTKLAGEKIEYDLPKDALLKLNIVVKNPNQNTQKIFVQYDNNEPEVIYYQPLNIKNASLPAEVLNFVKARENNAIAPTMRGSFAGQKLPFYFVDNAEIPIPGPAQKVAVWSDAQDLDIAVFYQAKTTTALSLADYASYMASLKNKDRISLFISGLNGKKFDALENNIEARLGAYWQDFYKATDIMIEKYNQNFVDKDPIKLDVWDDAKLNGAMQKAGVSYNNSNWLSAIAESSEIIQHGYPNVELYRNAYILRAKAMLELGETYQAEMQLKGAALFAKDEFLQQLAAKELEKFYAQNDQSTTMQSLRAAMFKNNPSAKNVIGFASAMQNGGEPRKALELLLLLPEKDQDYELLAAASYGEAMWDIFDNAVSKLPHERRALWKGYKAQKQGLYTTAISYWDGAGDAGKKLSGLFYQGMKLVRSIKEIEEKQFQNDWAAWIDAVPSGSYWQQFGGETTAKNSVRLKDKNGDLSSVYYHISPNEPLVINVNAHQKLRFEVRALLADERLKDEWLEIKSDKNSGQHYLMANNEPDFNYVIENQKGIYAGDGRNFIYNSGDNQRLEIKTANKDAIIRVQIEAKTLPLAVLPDVQMPLKTLTQKLNIPKSQDVKLVQNCAAQNELLASPAIQWKKLWYESALVKKQEFQPLTNNRKMELENLAWEAEHGQVNKLEVLAKIYAEKERSPHDKYLSEIAAYFEKTYDWKKISDPVESSGMQQVSQNDWQSDSPSLKIHASLMGDSNFDNLLHGQDVLSLATNNRKQAVLKISLKQYAVPYTKLHEAKLIYTIGKKQEVIIVPADGEKTLSVNVPAGAQKISLKFADPVREQFIKITIDGIDKKNSNSYFIASAEKPFKIYSQKAMLLRINEYDKDNNAKVYYRYVPENSGYVNIAPRNPEVKTIQVFSLEDSPNPPAIWENVNTDKPTSFVEKLVDKLWITEPALPISGSDDEPIDLKKGTWSAYTQIGSYNDFNEDLSQKARFVAEIGGQYRYHNKDLNSYFRTDFVERNNENGDPTLGLKQWWDWYPVNSPWSFELSGEAYTQSGESSAVIREQATRRDYFGNNLTNDFTMGALQRLLSLDNVSSAELAETDIDVFSQYKRDHMQQVFISDELAYAPTEDSKFYIMPTLTTNENLSADNILVKLGYKQLIGRVSTDASIGIKRSFKDDDRPAEKDTVQLGLDLNWMPEQKKRKWYVKLQNIYDTQNSDLSTLLSVKIAFDDDKFHRNYRPTEIDFPKMRDMANVRSEK
jgi:hypothetical protein